MSGVRRPSRGLEENNKRRTSDSSGADATSSRATMERSSFRNRWDEMVKTGDGSKRRGDLLGEEKATDRRTCRNGWAGTGRGSKREESPLSREAPRLDPGRRTTILGKTSRQGGRDRGKRVTEEEHKRDVRRARSLPGANEPLDRPPPSWSITIRGNLGLFGEYYVANAVASRRIRGFGASEGKVAPGREKQTENSDVACYKRGGGFDLEGGSIWIKEEYLRSGGDRRRLTTSNFKVQRVPTSGWGKGSTMYLGKGLTAEHRPRGPGMEVDTIISGKRRGESS